MNDLDEKPTVLIVDDEPANLKILIATLEDDYNLVVAKNGADALERVTYKTPDLILLDIEMPVMTGYEACEKLKQDPKYRSIPVIFISVLSSEEDEMHGFSIGAVDYITKPFRPSIVQARVRTHIELKKHRDHLEALAEARAQQLIHSERLATLGTLSAGIVHEINNPLLYMSLSSELLQKEFDKTYPKLLEYTDGQAEETERMMEFLTNSQGYISSIAEGVQRVIAIMKSMKDFSRRDVEEKTDCDMVKCIEDSLKLCNNELKYHTIVEKRMATGLPPFAGMARQIEQVFINLFHNAAQAMQENHERGKRGLLIITAEQVENNLRVVVEDTGPGIPPDKLETIWEAFFTTKPSETGTGLGLSISKGIVQDHLGRIRAENREEGGARFILELPVRRVEEE
jgi:signal transduction histidine kinase